jgi:hypothetical protein
MPVLWQTKGSFQHWQHPIVLKPGMVVNKRNFSFVTLQYWHSHKSVYAGIVVNKSEFLTVSLKHWHSPNPKVLTPEVW